MEEAACIWGTSCQMDTCVPGCRARETLLRRLSGDRAVQGMKHLVGLLELGLPGPALRLHLVLPPQTSVSVRNPILFQLTLAVTIHFGFFYHYAML